MCEPIKKDINKILKMGREVNPIYMKGLVSGVDVSFSHFKSAVKGLIKYHEDRIEELIESSQNIVEKWGYDYTTEMTFLRNMMLIREEYKSINAIELWLEDAV